MKADAVNGLIGQKMKNQQKYSLMMWKFAEKLVKISHQFS